MGDVSTITADRYPKQGAFLGETVEVCFEFDSSCTIRGVVIRDDVEEPGQLIIQLENGWVVRSLECQYRPLKIMKTYRFVVTVKTTKTKAMARSAVLTAFGCRHPDHCEFDLKEYRRPARRAPRKK